MFSVNRADNSTIYCLPGLTEWGAAYGGRPTAPWYLPNPVILDGSPSFGLQAGLFGFRISWLTNSALVVEAATNLRDPLWTAVSTNTLSNGWTDFSDSDWTNHPVRFYRVRQP